MCNPRFRFVLLITIFLVQHASFSQTGNDCTKFENFQFKITKTCAGEAIGQIDVIIPDDTPDDEKPLFMRLDPRGQIIFSPSGSVSFEGLAAEKHKITISDGGFCVRVITVEVESEEALTFVIDHRNAGYDSQCDTLHNGYASLAPLFRGKRVSTPLDDFAVMWSNGHTSQTISRLDVGEYYVTVTNKFGRNCQRVDTVEITRNAKNNEGGSNFNDPDDAALIDQDFNTFFGIGSNGTTAILTENRSFSSLQFDFLPNIDEFTRMSVGVVNNADDGVILEVRHRDEDRNILQRFDPIDLLQNEQGIFHFDFDRTGKISDRISFNLTSKSGSGGLDAEIDDIFLTPAFAEIILPPSKPLQIRSGTLFSRVLDPPQGGENKRSFDSIERFTLCDADTMGLYSAFKISGGTTPYQLLWDLDGDNLYDDATGDSALIINPLTGIHLYGLKVEDSAGEKDSLQIELEILENRQFVLDFAEQGILDENEVLSICLNDEPIGIFGNFADANISGQGIVGDSLFDPGLAGAGAHTLIVSGPTGCDEPGLATILVQDDWNPAWEAFEISECDEPIDLQGLLLGDTIGRWYINGTLMDTSLFNPREFAGDMVEILYVLGIEPCNLFDSKAVTVESCATGINEFEKTISVQFFPNPIMEDVSKLEISSEREVELTLEIFNAQAVAVKTQHLGIIATKELRIIDIDISGLVSGVYFARLIDKEGRRIFRPLLRL